MGCTSNIEIELDTKSKTTNLVLDQVRIELTTFAFPITQATRALRARKYKSNTLTTATQVRSCLSYAPCQ